MESILAGFEMTKHVAGPWGASALQGEAMRERRSGQHSVAHVEVPTGAGGD